MGRLIALLAAVYLLGASAYLLGVCHATSFWMRKFPETFK